MKIAIEIAWITHTQNMTATGLVAQLRFAMDTIAGMREEKHRCVMNTTSVMRGVIGNERP